MTQIRDIDDAAEAEALLAASRERPVWIFKHSSVCPVSAQALEEYRRFVAEQASGDDAVFTQLEVRRSRPLSNAVAEATGVRHESPQAILLRDGAAAWHASHWAIRADALRRAAGRG